MGGRGASSTKSDRNKVISAMTEREKEVFNRFTKEQQNNYIKRVLSNKNNVVDRYQEEKENYNNFRNIEKQKGRITQFKNVNELYNATNEIYRDGTYQDNYSFDRSGTGTTQTVVIKDREDRIVAKGLNAVNKFMKINRLSTRR